MKATPQRAPRRARRVVFVGASRWTVGPDGLDKPAKDGTRKRRWAIYRDNAKVARQGSRDKAIQMALAMGRGELNVPHTPQAADYRAPGGASEANGAWPHRCPKCGCPYAMIEGATECHTCTARAAVAGMLTGLPRPAARAVLMRTAIREYYDRVHGGHNGGGMYRWEVEVWQRALRRKLEFYKGSRPYPDDVMVLWSKALSGRTLDADTA